MTSGPIENSASVTCTQCGGSIKVESVLGAMVTCSNCQAIVKVPESIMKDAPLIAAEESPLISTNDLLVAPPQLSTQTAMIAANPAVIDAESFDIAPRTHASPPPMPPPLPTHSSPPAPIEVVPAAQSLDANPAIEVNTGTLSEQHLDVAPVNTNAADPVSAVSTEAAAPAMAAATATTHATHPVAYRQSGRKRTQAGMGGGRRMTLVFGAVLFLGVSGFVGVKIKNNIERKNTETAVAQKMVDAEAEFKESNVDKAALLADEARRVWTGSKQELTPELVSGWRKRVEFFDGMKTQIDEMVTAFKAESENVSKTRTRLQAKKLASKADDDDSKPLLQRVDTLLGELDRIELRQKTDKLKTSLASTEETYRKKDIEEAAKQAEKLQKEMAEKPAVQDADLDKRLSVLVKRGEQLKLAKSRKLTASKDFAAARKEIQKQIDVLDEKNEDLKPLAARLQEIKRDILQEEKSSRALTRDERTKLGSWTRSIGGIDPNFKFQTIEGDGIGVRFDGKAMRFGFHAGQLAKRPFIEVGENRFLIEEGHIVDKDKGRVRHPQRVFRHAINLADAMKIANVVSDEPWDASDEAPFVSARRTTENGDTLLFLKDNLYTGKSTPKDELRKDIESDFQKKAEALALAVEKDSPTSDDVRATIAVAVRATAKEADWNDHLPGEFVRGVVNEGYIENNMPGADQRLKKELADFREAYTKISQPSRVFTGTSQSGNEVEEQRTFEDHSIWRIYDKASDTTTFAIKNPDDEKNCLFILYDYKGKLAEYPKDTEPVRARMTHQAVGVTASYDFAAKKMEVDNANWDLAAALESYAGIQESVRLHYGFGTPTWMLPPHVLLVDPLGNTKSMITPHGRIDIQDFSKIKDEKARVAAMEKFLDQLAVVLPTANYLHLYFRYFFEYTYDSPDTSHTTLLGSRAHCGDIHQTAYQSLERLMGGRYVGDCDDLAEYFMNVTRRQGKLSYVLSLPQHAACGWSEKSPNEDEHTFYVIDTGPPRNFHNKSLDHVIESAYRAYDDSGTMRFDPKSLGFLFRFNGEPTRTPYYLSSRMFVDKQYGESMERVQSYWHFHFYALGIQTMMRMIESGDKVAENCTELAGLYGMVHEVESSIHWTEEALKTLGPEDHLSRMSEQVRIATMWREEHKNDKALETLKPMMEKLRQLSSRRDSMKYMGMKLQAAGVLISIDQPWESWKLLKDDMWAVAGFGGLKIDHAASLTSAFVKMSDLVKAGHKLTYDEKQLQEDLDRLLGRFYAESVFENDDDFTDYMRKYAFIGLYYAGKMGREKLEAELLKDGPYPDPAVKRNHMKRRNNPEEEDWKWIRLSLASYSICIGDALDMDDPPEKWRIKDAVKLTDQMLKASDVARKFGSLATHEFALIASRALRACLNKDWKDFEAVLKETQERDWARLTSDIAETLGRGGRFLTVEEFSQQFRKFAQYVKARPAYFTVVYEAYRAQAYDQALAAAKISVELFPQDEDMKRELAYLQGLVQKRKSQPKEKPAEAKPAEVKAEEKPKETKVP